MEITLLKDFEQESPNIIFSKGAKIVVGEATARLLSESGHCDFEKEKKRHDAKIEAAKELQRQLNAPKTIPKPKAKPKAK